MKRLAEVENMTYRMQDETARIEHVLLAESSVEALLRTFAKAKSTSFENLLDPLLKVSMSISISISISLKAQLDPR